MDKTQPPGLAGTASTTNRVSPGRRGPRGVRAHPLVASLAGGLQATYAPPPPEDAMPDIFASLIARLDRSGPDAR